MAEKTSNGNNSEARRRKNDSVAPTAPHFNGYVVAIGASAGGLDALERLFDELPPHSGGAFVVIQHLSPDHKSMMANLLARHTAMPVITVENELEIEPGHVYLIPPGKNMTVSGSQLRLSPKNPRVLSLPIDLFFTSLAQTFGNHSIGVILSGTGSDGTRGAVAINDAGGLLLAQDPESAKFDGMPRSVMATGLVDYVLPPEALARQLVAHSQHAPALRPVNERTGVQADHNATLDQLLHLLHHVGGINFKDYKLATVTRRIERRMQVRHVQELEHYVRLLENDRVEINALRRELLIPVTSFFRDGEAFEILAHTAINTLIENRLDRQPIRVWVAGCATGEEAYSLAILFAEVCDQKKCWPPIKIFATDVEQHYIDTAGAGVFSEAIANEVGPERLERFFIQKGNHYTIRNEVRQNIIFARHNLLEDPPFTRIDLLTCRNVLIYWQPNAQDKVLRRFQYALAPNAYLFLGSSESVSSLHSDFTAVNSRHKIYRIVRHIALPLDLDRSILPRSSSEHRRRSVDGRRRPAWPSDAAIIDAGQTLLLRQYAPPSLLISEQRELIHVFGDASRYLTIPEGSISLDIAKLLPESMRPVAMALLHKAARDNAQLRSEAVSCTSAEGCTERVRLVIAPVSQEHASERFLLLSFEADTPVLSASGERAAVIDVAAETTERVQVLERELAATRDSLQATIEELETSNEELQATNEELMASNEELQSTNEELQSVNEELYTVNSEYQEKIEILNRLNAELDYMTRAVSIPTLFLDAQLQLTRFTSEATSLFKIRESDIGRPLDDFANSLDYPDMIADLRRTISQHENIEREISTRDGHWFLTRILPYIEQPHSQCGAVITFIDVTHLKDVQRMQAVLDSLPEHIAVLDAEGVIVMVNRAWTDFARLNGDPDLSHTGIGIPYLAACQASGMSGRDPSLLDQDEIARLDRVRQSLSEVLAGKRDTFTYQYPCHSDRERRWFLMHAAPLQQGGGAVVSHINITAWVEGTMDLPGST
ncbi:MAG TPA: chemotaxis protein CheB [Candidatus Competibacteraceae bacterium]|nr:chemotaxis protein CheB [Candidatus Competibacteraceae bacterium]